MRGARHAVLRDTRRSKQRNAANSRVTFQTEPSRAGLALFFFLAPALFVLSQESTELLGEAVA